METGVIVLIGILLGVGIILLLRQVACWYFKINEVRDLLKRIAIGE